MKNTLRALLLLFVMLFAWRGYAQSLTIDLTAQPVGAKGIVNVTYKGVNIVYLMGGKIQGALIYGDGTTFKDYILALTSEREITAIEFEGVTNSGRTANIRETKANSTFKFNETGTSTWSGASKELLFMGSATTTGYTITNLRIWLEDEEGDGGHVDALQPLGSDVHFYAQGHNLPYDGRPVTLAVVSDTKFRTALQPYLLWKTQQGYHVEEFYADVIQSETGKTGDALALEIRNRLMALDPRPSYVLLAGDSGEVPYFEPRTAMAGGQDAVTDFYYGEYSGDHFAEAAVGRFSATTVDQLKAQMEKTKYMAFIRPADAGWMHHSLIAHAPAGDISTKKAAEFGATFPTKFKDNTTKTVYPYSSSVNPEINAGCSQVAYIGHGSTSAWMEYSQGAVRMLENKNKYPVVLGLTCLSGSFQYNECLAETFMRMPEAGAVAYIGATRESWDGADNLFFYGGNSVYQTFEHIGFMRSLYHPDVEDASQITRTIGDAMNVGKMASRIDGEYSPFRQFSEFFTLFGDPTYQPYITVPQQMTINAPVTAIAGRCIDITTAPDAVVAISKDRRVVAVGVADHEGKLSLKVPADAPTGSCTLYSSAPFYNDLLSSIIVMPGDGGEDPGYVEEVAPRVQYKDVIDVSTAAAALPGYTKEYLDYLPESFGVGSPARYTMWAGTNITSGASEVQYQHWLTSPNDVIRGIYIRNRYENSSIITTTTGGRAAYVEVEWLHPCGQTEILGIYGSQTPYYDTRQAWNGEEGKKLGEIRKGDRNRLVIDGNWPYILIRAEHYEGHFGGLTNEQDDIFLRSLTIGWNRLEGESIFGDVDNDGDMDVDDVEALRYILANDLTTTNADINGDGRVSIGDITALIARLRTK